MNGYQRFLPASEMTEKETKIVAEYMLLPLIRTSFEHDRKIIAHADVKFKTIYLELLDAVITQVTLDLRRNKQEIFSNHIRMTRRGWFNYEVYVRGRLFEFVYQKSLAMDWIYERVRGYLKL
ncbi:hypothetical protein NIE88_12870 [Sporolactobacillus shoreicorticis]|uniref:Uncharacterized protein n=1 Tax=Sporolactobacillus shoreicorticis TaxID=1923877 RepID=A0ABW5S5Z0_9BACL|nr:hypothetical protein [Sporolactobacillus shoreicorticis]MCO7126657.1 hypothetical protein [Sporolactobacillus shoreicorticis]